MEAILLIFFKLRYELHMLQLNSYKNRRYLKWLSTDLLSKNRIIEYCILLFFIVVNFFFVENILLIKILKAVSVLFLSYLYFGIKPKKPLVFTKRAIRIFITSWGLVLFGFIVSGLLFFDSLFFSYKFDSLILIFSIISFAIITLANFILQPLEYRIGKKYIQEAKQILSRNKKLIVIGITGSYGKTSTKFFLQRILSEKYSVIMTPGSFNTTMGVVRTIRELLKPHHEVFIVEMGAKQIGDIKEICDIVHPKIGILTAVAKQHIETFKTLENIQKTKFELIESLPNDGVGFLNYDYKAIRNYKNNIKAKVYQYSTSFKSSSNTINNVKYCAGGTEFNCNVLGECLSIQTKLLGIHNVSNLLASILVAKHLELDNSKILYAIKKIAPVAHRLEVKKLTNGITVLDDAFNSNPLGAKIALQVLRDMEGNKKIIVTPGMIELGQYQNKYNKRFAEHMADICDYVVLVGKVNKLAMLKGLKNKGFDINSMYEASNLKEAIAQISKITRPGDIVLYENDLPDTFEK